jgi:transposase-like protein
MSWDIQDTIGRRHEFVTLALTGSVSMAELCRRFGISRKTGYKWRERFAMHGVLALVDRPQDRSRPRQQTPARTEAQVLALRRRHPTWGPRKLHRRLLDLGQAAAALPAVSTFGRILHRAGCIAPQASAQHHPGQRFSRPEPNQLWQMDFKGHFALQRQGRCHPLTVLDDCSRFSVGIMAGQRRVGNHATALRPKRPDSQPNQDPWNCKRHEPSPSVCLPRARTERRPAALDDSLLSLGSFDEGSMKLRRTFDQGFYPSTPVPRLHGCPAE